MEANPYKAPKDDGPAQETAGSNGWLARFAIVALIGTGLGFVLAFIVAQILIATA